MICYEFYEMTGSEIVEFSEFIILVENSRIGGPHSWLVKKCAEIFIQMWWVGIVAGKAIRL